MSEMELSCLTPALARGAAPRSARRGELFLTVAIGYVKVRHDRIAKDPDRRVQEAIGLVFRKFAEFQSIRQVHLWLRQGGSADALGRDRSRGPARRLEGAGPQHSARAPDQPASHAGAYAFGRTASRVAVENGRKRVVRGHRREREEWDVLIVDHHEGYVSWAEFERQRLIADNANCRGLMARGSVRRGDALLAGPARAAAIAAVGSTSPTAARAACRVRYSCRGAHLNHGTQTCIAFGGMRVDAAVSAEALRLLSPLGVEAALAAVAMRDAEIAEARRQAELALTQARFEADLARRQYDAVDPANRLVAAELERRWNDRLAEAQRQEERLVAIGADKPSLCAAERERLLSLGEDLGVAWSHPGATAETRKRVLGAVLEEIVATLTEERIELLLHWRGGDHTRLSVPRNRTGQHRYGSDAEVRDLIRALARQQEDGAIAATLNRPGPSAPATATHGPRPASAASGAITRVPAHRPGEMAEREELTLEEASRRLGVSKMTVLRLIGDGTITAGQACKGAPWAIPAAQIAALTPAKLTSGRPRTTDPAQKALDLQ